MKIGAHVDFHTICDFRCDFMVENIQKNLATSIHKAFYRRLSQADTLILIFLTDSDI